AVDRARLQVAESDAHGAARRVMADAFDAEVAVDCAGADHDLVEFADPGHVWRFDAAIVAWTALLVQDGLGHLLDLLDADVLVQRHDVLQDTEALIGRIKRGNYRRGLDVRALADDQDSAHE